MLRSITVAQKKETPNRSRTLNAGAGLAIIAGYLGCQSGQACLCHSAIVLRTCLSALTSDIKTSHGLSRYMTSLSASSCVRQRGFVLLQCRPRHSIYGLAALRRGLEHD